MAMQLAMTTLVMKLMMLTASVTIDYRDCTLLNLTIVAMTPIAMTLIK